MLSISPTPHERPSHNLPRLLESAASAARAYCPSHSQWGALAEACTDAHWQAIHGNPGVPVLRPVHADPGALDPAASSAVRQTHKDQLRAYQGHCHCEARAALRGAVLRSISEADTDNLRDIDTGLDLISANDVIAEMVANHGQFFGGRCGFIPHLARHQVGVALLCCTSLYNSISTCKVF
jgi:hypothetical protein